MSLFKAPSWAKTPTVKPEDEAEKDMFRHSDSFLSIRKEQIEREKKRAEKAKAKAGSKMERQSERKPFVKRQSEEGDAETLKKRRITAADSAKLLAGVGISVRNSIDLGDSDEDDVPDRKVEPEVRRLPRNKRTQSIYSPVKSRSHPSTPIDAGQRDEDEVEIIAIEKEPLPSPPEEDEDYDSDPEIAELKRKAREKYKASQLRQSDQSAANIPGANATEASNGAHTLQDPIIKLLITSEIPDTIPLIICRKMSQDLAPVKDAWCSKQPFSADFAEDVILTHCGHKLYHFSTVRRLSLEHDDQDRPCMQGDASQKLLDRIHIEAMTQKDFDRMQTERTQRAALARAKHESELEAPANVTSEPEPQTKLPKISLTVKAKGKPDCHFIVTKITRIRKILKIARKDFAIPEEQGAYLEFDGDHLDPSDEIGNTDIAEMDECCLNLFLSN